MSGAAAAPVGVFGGTFNPVHYGHLRSAVELVERLELAELRLMPCAVPPHREAPRCSARDRAAMVELAVAGEPRLVCDPRELQREGPSYTLHSLTEIRAELGPQRSMVLVMGCDAALELETWHRWQELPQLAHIVVIARPGWQLPRQGPLAQWLDERRAESAAALAEAPCGTVLVQQLRPLAISSTEIRALLQAGRSARYLLPKPVLDYIQERGLYN